LLLCVFALVSSPPFRPCSIRPYIALIHSERTSVRGYEPKLKGWRQKDFCEKLEVSNGLKTGI